MRPTQATQTKRVRAKPFREYLRRQDSPDDFAALPTYLVQRGLFNGVTLNLLVALILLIASIWSRFAFLLLITQSLFLTWLFIHTQIVAHGIFVRRKLESDVLREGQAATVLLEISNVSSYIASGLVLEEIFGPSKKSRVLLSPETQLPPFSRARLRYTRLCDGGMGRNVIGPLQIKLTDPFGIFEFRIDTAETLEVEVQPQIETVTDFPVRGSPGSSQYGSYEIASRGLSVNFSGVRPYTTTDSLRHIAWKLSNKGQGLLVKEFERVVNSEVTVILNLDRYLLTGHKANSTWEYAKDTALAIISQQCELGNRVSLFTTGLSVEPGHGREHALLLSKRLANHTPFTDDENDGKNDDKSTEPQALLRRAITLIRPGSTVFYIAPYHEYEHHHNFPLLGHLQASGTQVFCIYIDTDSFWTEVKESILAARFIHLTPTTGFEAAMDRLRLAGIHTYRIQNRMSLLDSLSLAHRRRSARLFAKNPTEAS